MNDQAMTGDHVKAFLFLFFVLSTLFGVAQQPVFKHFTVKDGLPSNEVYDVYQDVNGYIWFATDRGICRYDGYTFESFGVDDGLTDNTVFRFFPQKDGSVWCSTFNGTLFYFHPDDYVFKSYTFNDTLTHWFSRHVPMQVLTNDGALMISSKTGAADYLHISKNGELLKTIDDARVERLSIEATLYHVVEKKWGQMFTYHVPEPPEKGKIIAFCESNRVESTHAECALVDSVTNTFFFVDRNSISLAGPSGPIRKLNVPYMPINAGIYDDSSLYASYHNDGFHILNRDGTFKYRLLNGQSGTDVLDDHEGGFWFSTLHDGVYYLPSDALIHFDDERLHRVQRLAKDDDGDLWMKVHTDQHLLYERKSGELHLRESFMDMDVYPVSYDEDERTELKWNMPHQVHAGTYDLSMGAGIRYDVSTENFIRSDSFARGKLIPALRLANDIVIKDSIYLVAYHRGVYCIKGDSFWFHTNEKLQQRIEHISIRGQDEIYSTLSSGLVIVRGDTTLSITRQDGLFSNVVNRTLVENDSTLWVCTNFGLNKVVFTDSGFKVHGDASLSTIDVSDMEILRDTLWLGTRSGLYAYPKSSYTKAPDPERFFMQVREVMVNQGLYERDLADLSHNENNITFRFGAISFRHGHQIRYRYRVLSHEQWNVTANRSVIFSNLAPGRYDFTVQASVDGRDWSNEVSVPFEIHPPFYATWWFRVLAFVLIGVLIYTFFRVRVLSYNRDVLRELIRLAIRKLSKGDKYLLIREAGKNIRIPTSHILYVASANNYIEIFTVDGKYTIREKISNFLSLVPDPLEYLRIHRSYIVRIDRVTGKARDSVMIGNTELNVARTYLKNLDQIQL